MQPNPRQKRRDGGLHAPPVLTFTLPVSAQAIASTPDGSMASCFSICGSIGKPTPSEGGSTRSSMAPISLSSSANIEKTSSSDIWRGTDS